MDQNEIIKLISDIEADGKITRDEIKKLHAAFMNNNQLDDHERALLQKLIGKLQRGELKEVD